MLKKVILISLFFVTACARDIVDLTGSITGTVKDYDSGELISNCQISITPGGESLSTGSDGQFEFKDLEQGTYNLAFKKSGYEDATKSVSVIAGQSAKIQLALKALKGELSVSETELDFGSATATMSFTISNPGKGNLEWSVSENADWLSCSPVSGTVLPSKSVTVVAAVDRTGKGNGNYSENIVVSSNDGNAMIAVSMSVTPVDLTLSPASLDFGAAESSIGVSMTNPSGKTLKYNIATSNDWLSVSKSSGSITTTDSFNAIVSRSGLSAGDYDGNIVIMVEGGEFSIPVKMKVSQKEKPSVSIEEVNSVTAGGATIKAAIKSIGSSKVTRYGVCWSTSSTPTVDDKISNLGDCTGAKSYESTISELDAETKYYVRAYAENTEGLAYSDQTLSFTTSTKPTIPSVSTVSTSNVTPTSAVATGRITSLGNVAKITEYGHVWGTSPQPTLSDCAHTSLGEATSAKDFSSEVTDLSAGTKYYIRAYATNPEGTAYGEDLTFTTKDYEAPAVSIGQTSNIQRKSFSVSGEIKSTGGISLDDYGHCWSTSQNPTTSDAKTSFGSKSTGGSFNSDITGLDEGTTYYVRAYAVNSKGTSYSSQITVTTTAAGMDKWDGSMASSFAGGSGTLVDPYRIESGAQLVLMKNYAGKCFILSNNIDLDNKNWPSFDFSGSFDGKGFTISNLKVTKTGDNLGFFATCSGTVKNLKIKGVDIQSGQSDNIGSIAGLLRSNGTIMDCSVIFNSESKIMGNSCVGGIVGYYGDHNNSQSMTISGCRVNSTSSENVILGNSCVGGIVGYKCYCVNKKGIENCCVDAMLYGGAYVGGICGGGNSYSDFITKCSFKGAISGESYLGGIYGGDVENVSRGRFYITGCKSDVTIDASVNYAGGIYGYALGGVRVRGSYSAGSLKLGNSSAKYLGGIGGFTNFDYSEQQELCYSVMTSTHPAFGGLGGYSDLRAKDCATTVADKNERLTNCNTGCTDITDFLRSCYSEYADYYNFNNTWTWAGVVDGKTVSVSCPKLAWE